MLTAGSNLYRKLWYFSLQKSNPTETNDVSSECFEATQRRIYMCTSAICIPYL